MAATLDLVLRSGRRARLEVPAPTGDEPSVFCFTMAHSGADEFGELVGGLCRAAARSFLDIEEALARSGVQPDDLAPEAWRALASLRGYVIMAAPSLWSVAEAPPMRRALFLRDPRDVAATVYVNLDEAERGATFVDFLDGAVFGDLLQSYRAYLSQPRARNDLLLRYEHALDGWREVAVDLAAFLELPLPSRQTRAIADATRSLGAVTPELRMRDATVQALMELNGAADRIAPLMGFALEALGCPETPTLWRMAETGEIARSIRRPPPSPPDYTDEAARGLGEPDPVLNYRLRANAWLEREVGGRRIRLETDEFGQRVTLGQPAAGEKLVSFYGCSFTFGTTSNVDETFCSLLQGMLPRWRIENHGVAGYSQSRNLIALERDCRFNPPDLVGFCWIRDHLRRNVADIGWVQATSKGAVGNARVAMLPRAALDAKGELAMSAVRYPRAELEGVDVAGYEPSPEYLDTVCFKLFERADALVRGYGGRFFVVDLHGRMSPALTEMLRSAGIPLVKTIERGPEYFVTPTDLHPNALAHRVFAEKIHAYLADLR